MELDKDKETPITPDNDSINWKEQAEKNEKRFTDTQSAFTKARQQEIEMAKILVDTDPSAVERIPDKEVRNKVLQNKWWVDNLEELKVMFPDYNKKDNDDDWEELSKLEKIERELSFMKYKASKDQTEDSIKNIEVLHKDIVDQIPDFKTKMKDELKYISNDITPSERVEKAFKLISGWMGNSANTYAALQWVTLNKIPKDVTDVDDDQVNNIITHKQNILRKTLGVEKKKDKF